MILVDTSVWVDHLRNDNRLLADRLVAGTVRCHPLIVAELALGTLKSRGELLTLLDDLPGAPRASDSEVRTLIEDCHLMGRGIGVVGLHLVASCLLSPGTSLWSTDRRLNTVAEDMQIPLAHASN